MLKSLRLLWSCVCQHPFVESTGSGMAEFQPFAKQLKIQYSLNVTDIEQVSSAHLHLGTEGQENPVVLNLFTSETPLDFRRETGMLEEGRNITASDLQGPLARKELSDSTTTAINGQMYVDVHTENHPEGEIRGRLIA